MRGRLQAHPRLRPVERLHVRRGRRASVRTVEELEALSRSEKDARKQARADARAAKLAKKIAFYQKRVDSGVKQRKPHLIADAFEAAQRSLSNDFNYHRGDAVGAIERDHVFAAFGLDVRADARDEPNRAILSRMTDTRYAWTAPLPWPALASESRK